MKTGLRRPSTERAKVKAQLGRGACLKCGEESVALHWPYRMPYIVWCVYIFNTHICPFSHLFKSSNNQYALLETLRLREVVRDLAGPHTMSVGRLELQPADLLIASAGAITQVWH